VRPKGICREPSTCHANTCVEGAPTLLPERWRYTAPGHRLFFEGTVDEAGNTYFTESGAALELVALRPDGSQLFRVQLQPQCTGCTARLMLDPAGGRIFAGRRGLVQARSLADGRLLWSRDTSLGKVPRSTQSDGGVIMSTSAFIALSPDVVVEQLSEGYDVHREYSIALERSTGRVLWERDWWGHVYFPGTAGNGELWITSADCWAPIQQSQLVGASSGATSATVTSQARPIAFLDGEALLVGNNGLTWASPQGVKPPLASAGYPYWALASGGRTVVASYNGATELGGSGWSRNFPGYVATGALLADGGTLVTAYAGDGGATLYGIGPSGADLFQCALPGTVSSASPVRGLWVAAVKESIVAFELPGVELAPRGWVTPAGNPLNDHRPR
jgi:hypothetical protein